MGKIFNVIAMAVAAVLLFIFIFLVIERNKKVTLPSPTGEFGIGRTTFEWTDTSKTDTLALEPGARELFVWVWYPSPKPAGNVQSEYMPGEWQDAISERRGLFSNFFNKNLSKVRAHGIDKAKLPEQGEYPVILLKSGIGGPSVYYSTVAEELASHGYIVIGSDSPYSTDVVVFSGNRVVTDNSKGNPSHAVQSVDRDRKLDRLVTIWTDDLSFILDKLQQINTTDPANLFYNRINMKQIGVFGATLGGATAFRFCNLDNRCKAGVSINGNPFGIVNENKLSKPFMFLMPANTSAQVKNNIDTIYSELPAENRLWINIEKTSYLNFSDQALFREHFIAKNTDEIGEIDKHQALEITATTIRSFFDIHLKGKPSSVLQEIAEKYMEIEMKK